MTKSEIWQKVSHISERENPLSDFRHLQFSLMSQHLWPLMGAWITLIKFYRICLRHRDTAKRLFLESPETELLPSEWLEEMDKL